MRTLIISDLHIGQGGGTAALERPRPTEMLISALADYERLVLLGDVIELQESGWNHSAPICEAILRRLGAAVPNIVLVPGNHDHSLIRAHIQQLGPRLAREQEIPNDATSELEQLTGWLGAGGASVEVSYPGVWLTDTIWATHGHYLNHFLKPISSWGAHCRQYRVSAPPSMSPVEFEHVAYIDDRPRMHDGLPPQRWHDRLIPEALAPTVSWGLDIQVRRHALPALGNCLVALGLADSKRPPVPGGVPVPAPAAAGPGTAVAEPRRLQHAIFGHIHRRGPLPLDNPREWQLADTDVRLLNTGSWRFEPVVANRADGLHPYWPGGAVEIGEDGVPRPFNMLQSLTATDLR